MCLPLLAIPLLTLATTAVSAGLSYASQSAAASAQNATARQVAANSDASFRAQQAYASQRLIQLQARSGQQGQAKTIEAAQASGRVRAGAAETGATGVNLDALVGDINRQLGQSLDSISYNRQIAFNDEQTTLQNAYYQGQDRRNSVPLARGPSILTPLLATAGSALDLGVKYNDVTSKAGGLTLPSASVQDSTGIRDLSTNYA